jgi:hypothetical protein
MQKNTMIEFRDIGLGYAAQTTHEVEKLLGRKPKGVEQFARDYAEVWAKTA